MLMRERAATSRRAGAGSRGKSIGSRGSVARWKSDGYQVAAADGRPEKSRTSVA